METIRVASGEQGTRLDKFINSQRPELSRSFLQTLIADGTVEVNGKPRKPNYSVKASDTITFEIPEPKPTPALPEALPLDILYEDKAILVLNKAAGMVVHPAAGHVSGTLVNAILNHAPEVVTGNRERPGIVHRLDRDTSGVIVVAKNDSALHELQRQFAAREVHKTYLALVNGILRTRQGKIDAPLVRDPHDRKRIVVGNEAAGRQAVTVFSVLAQAEPYTLLQVEPETGRTHQIRVHLAFLKHPVVADPVYGKKRNELGLTRQFLHAWRIEFRHPISQASLTFTAPLPEDLRIALARAHLPALTAER